MNVLSFRAAALVTAAAYVFPVLDPARPGRVERWERRTYDDVLTLEAPAASGPAQASPPKDPP